MKTIAVFILAAAAALLVSCRSLDPSGPYHGDKALYTADRAIAGAYDALHAFVLWEYENREKLESRPQLRQAADAIRKNAQSWLSKAIAARDWYAALRTKAARKTMDAAVSELNNAALQVINTLEK